MQIAPRWRHPFTFPGWAAPGVDPSHPASANLRFSGIPIPTGGYINLMTGAPGTVAGTPTAGIDKDVGPYTGGNSNASGWTFSGNPAVTESPITMAAIVSQVNGGGNLVELFRHSTGAAAIGFGMQNGTGLYYDDSGFGARTVVSNALNTTDPWFVGISGTLGGTIYGVIMNMKTGQMFTGSTAAGGAGASNGTYSVGTGGSAFGTRLLGPTMYSAVAMNLDRLMAWAQNPWSFWYPDSLLEAELVGASVAPAGGSVFRSLMGVGK